VNSHRGQAVERGAGGAPVCDLGQRLLDASYLEGDFVLRSGRHSKFYLDKYLFSTKPDLLRDIASGLAQKLPAYEPFELLAGPELGAVAIVAAVSLACGKPFVIVRKEQKGYGTEQCHGRARAEARSARCDGRGRRHVRWCRADGRRQATRGRLIRRRAALRRGSRRGGRAQIEAKGLTFDALFTATSLGIRKPA
jgi:orotate phosphoribosyltransferase